MSLKLSRIIETNTRTKEFVESLSLLDNNAVNDYKHFLNVGKLGSLQGLTRDVIEQADIVGATPQETEILNQGYPPSAIEPLP